MYLQCCSTLTGHCTVSCRAGRSLAAQVSRLGLASRSSPPISTSCRLLGTAEWGQAGAGLVT